MNKRERTLAILTGAAVVGWLVFNVFGADTLLGGGAGSGRVESARQKYESTVERVSTAPKVYEEFYRLVGTESELEKENEAGYAADLAFQSDIARWAQSVGFPRPRFDMKVEDIRDPQTRQIIEDYQLVVMTISLPEGDLKRFSQLLKLFESNGLIIQHLDLRASGNNQRLSAEITVARLVRSFKLTPARVNMRR